jgi:hypothetical protein
MVPAPASIAAPPTPKSRASWNPAVPPPPVGGAAVGNGLVDGLGVSDGDADGLADSLGVTDRDADGLALGVVTSAVSLAEAVGVAETLPPGENLVGAAEGEDAVHAEIAAEASMVKVPQPMAVNLALSPVAAVVVRTFMEPPHASAGGGPVSRSWPQKPASERKRVAYPVAARACRRQVPESAEDHKGKAHGRPRHAMACSPLEY